MGVQRWKRCCPARGFIIVLLLTASSLAFGDDRQKAEKQVRRINAMAVDATARCLVSKTISDMMEVSRPQLVRERRAMSMNYGSLFIAHELTSAGSKMLDIALQLQAGKDIFQIADGQMAGRQKMSWRQLTADAKRLNAKIEDNIYHHFLHSEPDKERDLADHYNPDLDWVKADKNVVPEEIEQAQLTYVFWRNQASSIKGVGTLDHITDETLLKDADSAKGARVGTISNSPPVH
jgi:hypothetical protein